MSLSLSIQILLTVFSWFPFGLIPSHRALGGPSGRSQTGPAVFQKTHPQLGMNLSLGLRADLKLDGGFMAFVLNYIAGASHSLVLPVCIVCCKWMDFSSLFKGFLLHPGSFAQGLLMMSLFDVVTLATVAWKSSSFCAAGPSFLCLAAQIQEEGRGVCDDCCGLHQALCASVSCVRGQEAGRPGFV